MHVCQNQSQVPLLKWKQHIWYTKLPTQSTDVETGPHKKGSRLQLNTKYIFVSWRSVKYTKSKHLRRLRSQTTVVFHSDPPPFSHSTTRNGRDGSSGTRGRRRPVPPHTDLVLCNGGRLYGLETGVFSHVGHPLSGRGAHRRPPDNTKDQQSAKRWVITGPKSKGQSFQQEKTKLFSWFRQSHDYTVYEWRSVLEHCNLAEP